MLPEGSALRRLARGNPTSGARWPRGVATLVVVTLVLTLLYLGSTTLRRPGTSSFFFDVVIANLGYAGCTALVAWRAVSRRRGRWGWGSLAAGLFLFTTGSVLWTTWVQYFNPVPYPSISDACFLTFFFLAFIGIALLVRETVPRTSRTIWVDGLIAGLGVAALETTLVISPIASLNSGDGLTVATNIAYPIGDLVLVTMVVAVFAVRGWRPGRLWWLLGIGLVVFAAADSVYVLRVLSNTYVTGTPLDSLWLIGALFMAFAAWQRMGVGSAARNLPTVEAPNIIPVVFLLTSVGIIVYATTHPKLLPLGVVLATVTLVYSQSRGPHMRSGSCVHWRKASARHAQTNSPACQTAGSSSNASLPAWYPASRRLSPSS